MSTSLSLLLFLTDGVLFLCRSLSISLPVSSCHILAHSGTWSHLPILGPKMGCNCKFRLQPWQSLDTDHVDMEFHLYVLVSSEAVGPHLSHHSWLHVLTNPVILILPSSNPSMGHPGATLNGRTNRILLQLSCEDKCLFSSVHLPAMSM